MLIEKVGGIRTALLVWRKVREGVEHPSGKWFGERFIDAATIVVDRWGPRWARRRVGRGAIGAWLLLLAWIGVPVLIVRGLW